MASACDSGVGVEERLCGFFVTKYEQYIDVEQMKQYQISLSADGTLVALGTSRHLIITDDRAVVSEESPPATVETILEFSTDSGKCTALRWLTDEVICLGFESGDFACFDMYGNGIIEQKCDNTSVQALRISDSSLPGIEIEYWPPTDLDKTRKDIRLGCQYADRISITASLWILHESGVLAVVPLRTLLVGRYVFN